MKAKSIQINPQRGMILIVALVMVVLMSVVAVASIRGSGLQEAMSGSMRDRNIAFQGAEAALRIAEETVADPDIAIGDLVDNNAGGYFIDLNKNTAALVRPRPLEWTLADWKGRGLELSGIDNVSAQPFAVTEQLSYSGSAINSGGGIDFMSQERSTEYQFYRVTVRSVGLTENTEIILQSTYVR
jgi:type IV pilus assembly protein PilX